MPRKREPDSEIVVNTTKMMALLDRIERLEEEKAALQGDISDVWSEAKAEGYSIKHLRKTHALRKLAKEDREMIATYANALHLFEN